MNGIDVNRFQHNVYSCYFVQTMSRKMSKVSFESFSLLIFFPKRLDAKQIGLTKFFFCINFKILQLHQCCVTVLKLCFNYQTKDLSTTIQSRFNELQRTNFPRLNQILSYQVYCFTLRFRPEKCKARSLTLFCTLCNTKL